MGPSESKERVSNREGREQGGGEGEKSRRARRRSGERPQRHEGRSKEGEETRGKAVRLREGRNAKDTTSDISRGRHRSSKEGLGWVKRGASMSEEGGSKGDPRGRGREGGGG